VKRQKEKRRADGLDRHDATHHKIYLGKDILMGEISYLEEYRMKLNRSLMGRIHPPTQSGLRKTRLSYIRATTGHIIEQHIRSDGSTELVVVPSTEPFGHHSFR